MTWRLIDARGDKLASRRGLSEVPNAPARSRGAQRQRVLCPAPLRQRTKPALRPLRLARQLLVPQTVVALAHESLVAWQRADDLVVAVYRLSGERFPREEA